MIVISGNPLGLERYYDVSDIIPKIFEGLDIKPGIIGISIHKYENVMGTMNTYEFSSLMVNWLDTKEIPYFLSKLISPKNIKVAELENIRNFAIQQNKIFIMIYDDVVDLSNVNHYDIFISLDQDKLNNPDGSTIYIKE